MVVVVRHLGMTQILMELTLHGDVWTAHVVIWCSEFFLDLTFQQGGFVLLGFFPHQVAHPSIFQIHELK